LFSPDGTWDVRSYECANHSLSYAPRSPRPYRFFSRRSPALPSPRTGGLHCQRHQHECPSRQCLHEPNQGRQVCHAGWPARCPRRPAGQCLQHEQGPRRLARFRHGPREACGLIECARVCGLRPACMPSCLRRGCSPCNPPRCLKKRIARHPQAVAARVRHPLQHLLMLHTYAHTPSPPHSISPHFSLPCFQRELRSASLRSMHPFPLFFGPLALQILPRGLVPVLLKHLGKLVVEPCPRPIPQHTCPAVGIRRS
jgi:hypothetical protein